MLTVDKPKWMADQINQASQKIGISAENAATNRMNAGSRAISANAAATSAAARAADAQVNVDNAVARTAAITKTADARMMDAQTHVKQGNLAQARIDSIALTAQRAALTAEYNNIGRQITTMIANNKDPALATADITLPDGTTKPGPSVFDQEAAIQAKLEEVSGVLGSTQAAVGGGPSKVVQQASGNGTANVGGDQFKAGSAVPGATGYTFTGQKDAQGNYLVKGEGRTRPWKP
jgi:hypothetical protein